MEVSDLKKQRVLTREDIAFLLASIGPPGEKRKEKLDVVAELNRQNRQGHDMIETLESYQEY